MGAFPGCHLWALLVHLLLGSPPGFAGSSGPTPCAGGESAECEPPEADSPSILQVRPSVVAARRGLGASGSRTPKSSEELYNGVGYMSERALDFLVAMVVPSIQESLAGFLLLDSHELTIDGAGPLPKVEISNLTLRKASGHPRLEVASEFTRKGFNLKIPVHDLHANGSAEVSYPKALGSVNVSGSVMVYLKLKTSIQNGRFAVKAYGFSLHNLDLHADLDLNCHMDMQQHYLCEPITTLNTLDGPLVEGLAKSVKHYLARQGKARVNEHLAKALEGGMPTELPLSGSHGLVLNFTPEVLTQVADMKSLAMQVLVIDSESPGVSAPIAQVPANQPPSGSMFAAALSSSVPNSYLAILFSKGIFFRDIISSMVPEGDDLQLNSGSLGKFFWATWWKAMYATTCPLWSRCDVRAEVRSSRAPALKLAEQPARVTVPVSVDFFVMYGGTTDFMWRVNATLWSDVDMLIAPGAKSCQQLLRVELSNFSVSSIQVTKTHKDSSVSVSDGLSTALPLFLKLAVPDVLRNGIVLNPILVGDSSFALLNSSIDLERGLLKFRTDVAAAGNCTGKQGALPQFLP